MEARRWVDLLGDRAPIDVFGAADSRGIQVEQESLALNLTGALICAEDATPLISIEARDAMPWRRYTCAFLLGHFAQLPASPTCHVHFDRRSMKSKDRDPFDATESYAHEFALHLLMPEGTVRNLHAQNPSLFELARCCGVPPRIMKERTDALGLSVNE